MLGNDVVELPVAQVMQPQKNADPRYPRAILYRAGRLLNNEALATRTHWPAR
jgi:hypothetical protein